MNYFRKLTVVFVSLMLGIAVVCGQQTTGNLQTCTYSFLVANNGDGPQSTCSGSASSDQMNQLKEQVSTLQRQVQNLQRSGGSGGGRTIAQKPSFNCQCGANSTVNFVFRDCEDVAELMEAAVPGVYQVEPLKETGRLISVQDAQGRKDKFWLAQTLDPVEVFCDFDEMGVAWTVLMRRRNFDVSFNRTWQEYKDGFGDINNGGDFWLGLEKMHLLTSQRSPGSTLWMIIRDDRNIPRVYGYGKFSIGAEDEHYALKVSDFHGQERDYFQDQNIYYGNRKNGEGQKFETRDQKSPYNYHEINCASQDRAGYIIGGGGWWFSKTSSLSSYEGYGCGRANLNAPKPKWGDIGIKSVEMRMRPNL